MSDFSINFGSQEEAFDHYTIQESTGMFYNQYTITKENSTLPIATVKTNNYAVSLWNFYDCRQHYFVYNQEGKLQSEGIKATGLSFEGMKHLSFLSYFKPATQSDHNVYDANGEKLGFIDGRMLSISKACFDFYDKDHNFIASAHLDKEKSSITFYDAKNPDKIVGFMKRHFVKDVKDTWEVSTSKALDPKLTFIFSAFVVKHQSAFIEDK